MEKREITEEQALQRLAGLCSRGEYCSYDMTAKMHRWGLPETAQARVMAELVKGRYVDDSRFCRMFVRDKLKFNKWGRRKIEQALWAKRIDESVYRPFLDEVSIEEYAEILMPMLKAKRKSIKAASDYERDMKLIKYAMGRGFTMDVIKQCLNTDIEYAED